jgi:serine/threonine protein kinase/tetratricopeptide (TPR) repeat protein
LKATEWEGIGTGRRNMRTDRWQKIESLYHTARERRPEERHAYLESACNGDVDIMHEVESLLQHDELAASFLETDASGARVAVGTASVASGERIGAYAIEEFLRAGGMGEVYKACDTRLDRRVAIKFLPPAFSADPVALERFRRETLAISSLNHPRICTIHDTGEFRGRPFFVMELLEGESLRERLSRKSIPIPDVLDLAVQIADALQAAHTKNIVHRDIKPANIFITASGQIKILDFGLAKLGREPHPATGRLSEGDETVTGVSITRPGGIMGTLAYLSPEQARGEEVDARTDIFSFGVVLYQMATGRPAFRGETSGELIGAILHTSPPKPSAVNQRIPGGLDRIIFKALEKDRQARYQTAGEMVTDLEALRTSALDRPRTRRWVLASSTAVAAALAGGVFLPRLTVFSRRRIMLAVLPLADPNPDPKEGPFSTVLHNQIINILTRLYPEGLGVIASRSVQRYQGAERRVEKVGADLKVDYVVDGEVRRNGQDIRINARLIRVKDRVEVWNASFSRDLSHVLALQAEVAQAVATGIGRNLRPNERVQLTLARSLDPDAYEAFLRGDFARAVQLDPYWPQAYVNLAGQLYLPALFGARPPHPAFNQMLDAASKAVELDETLADAHANLALARLHTQWKWNEAEAGFRHAVQLEPNNPGVRHGFAHFLLWAGRGKESAQQCDFAQELDPFDPDLLGCRAWHDLWAGEYDSAIEYSRRALAFDPKQGFAALVMGWTYELKGRFPEAISAFQQVFPSSLRTASVGHALARSGKPQAAGDLLTQLLDDSRKKYVSPYNIAVIYAGLGDTVNAVTWLTKAFDEHTGLMVYVFLDPRLRSLRSNPQFQTILRGMGFRHLSA